MYHARSSKYFCLRFELPGEELGDGVPEFPRIVSIGFAMSLKLFDELGRKSDISAVRLQAAVTRQATVHALRFGSLRSNRHPQTPPIQGSGFWLQGTGCKGLAADGKYPTSESAHRRSRCGIIFYSPRLVGDTASNRSMFAAYRRRASE
jgi:hypothetical protein